MSAAARTNQEKAIWRPRTSPSFPGRTFHPNARRLKIQIRPTDIIAIIGKLSQVHQGGCMMRPIYLIIPMAIGSAGCMEQVVQKKANLLTRTVPELYMREIVDNLATIRSNPAAMPYFGIPQQGTDSNTRSIQANYGPGWDLTSVTRRFLFDKQSAMFQGQYQNQESFQVAPLNDPDKILLIDTAMRIALNMPRDPRIEANLRNLFDTYHSVVNYNDFVTPGHQWTCCVQARHEIPKGTRYWAEHDGCYVYIPNEYMADLTHFTLAILDIASIDTTRLFPLKTTPPATPGAGAVTLTSKTDPADYPTYTTMSGDEQNLTDHASDQIQFSDQPIGDDYDLLEFIPKIFADPKMIRDNQKVFLEMMPTERQAATNIVKRSKAKRTEINARPSVDVPNTTAPQFLLTPRLPTFPYPAPPNAPIVQ